MKANFDSPLARDASHPNRIKATGPLVWQGAGATPPTGTACVISATITQSNGGTPVVGIGQWNKNYQDGNQKWDGVVEANSGSFTPGVAFAEGVITVTSPSSPPQIDPWSQWVTLS